MSFCFRWDPKLWAIPKGPPKSACIGVLFGVVEKSMAIPGLPGGFFSSTRAICPRTPVSAWAPFGLGSIGGSSGILHADSAGFETELRAGGCSRGRRMPPRRRAVPSCAEVVCRGSRPQFLGGSQPSS